jgi:CheY-like chemotaxis protein
MTESDESIRPCVGIIDDDIALCSFMQEVAQQNGYRSVTVHDGQHLDRVLAQGPQVIVLDLSMRNVDGIDTIGRLVDLAYTGKVVLISGQHPSILIAVQTIARMRGLHVAGVLGKPIRAQTLTDLLVAQRST